MNWPHIIREDDPERPVETECKGWKAVCDPAAGLSCECWRATKRFSSGE